ncbi:hypothetical protein ABXV18_27070 [Vibrio owensii]|uniref:hypothetical protein n=1 Tax=Vibrio owensii TaxID=696485 RepID=UPI0033954A22
MNVTNWSSIQALKLPEQDQANLRSLLLFALCFEERCWGDLNYIFQGCDVMLEGKIGEWWMYDLTDQIFQHSDLTRIMGYHQQWEVYVESPIENQILITVRNSSDEPLTNNEYTVRLNYRGERVVECGIYIEE